jgi:hypothetical protein
VYTHQCPQCAAFYIPYDQDVPCPKCGQVEEERFDYIPQAVASMQFNKKSGRSYTPGAWWVGSLGDHILSILFGLFDGLPAGTDTAELDSYLAERLGRVQWGDQEYLRDHVHAIALRIGEELQGDEDE